VTAAGMPSSHDSVPRTRGARHDRPCRADAPQEQAPRGLRMAALLVLAFFVLDGAVRVAGSLWKPAHYHLPAVGTSPETLLPGPEPAPVASRQRASEGAAALPIDAPPSVSPSVHSRDPGALSAHAHAHRHGQRHDHGTGYAHGPDRRATAPEPRTHAHPRAAAGTGVGHHRHSADEAGVVYLQLEHPHSPLAPPRAFDTSGTDGWVPALYARRPWTSMDQIHAWHHEQVPPPLSWHVLPEGRPPWRARPA
jgi:hypothetical protein